MKYSSFGRLEEYDGLPSIVEWLKHPRLQRSMERRMQESQPGAGENFWDLLLLREAMRQPDNSLTSDHLSARLEETCFFVVRRICLQFASLKMSPVDCFLRAREETSKPTKLLKKFDSKLGYKITTYVQPLLRSAILEKARIGNSLLKYRPPLLLRNVSQKVLEEALSLKGVSDLFAYRLARQSFIEICFPSSEGTAGRTMPWPLDESQLNAIANRYNSRRQEYPPVSGDRIQTILAELDRAIRDSWQIRNVSIEDGSVSEPDLSYPEPELADEAGEDGQLVRSILSEAFASLPALIQDMMVIWHGFGFRQAEIALLFGLPDQTGVSKKLNRYQQQLLKYLLKALGDRFPDFSKIKLSSQQLSEIKKSFKEWLRESCQEQYGIILESKLKQDIASSPEIAELLQALYAGKLSPKATAKKLNLDAAAVKQQQEKVQSILCSCLESHLEANTSISFAAQAAREAAEKRLTVFVDSWLASQGSFF